MVCVSFYVICIVEHLVSSVICRFQGLAYSHVPQCIEFSFILFIHHNIHFYFELCTYCNILDIYLSWNMNSVKYLFIWNYWIIYLWHVWRYSGVLWVNSCPPLTRPHQAVMHEWALLHHWLCNQKHPWGICSCSPIVNFLKVTFYHGMVTLVIFLIKKIIYIDTLNMKICWVFMKIWIIFKSCCSLWHVENFRKYSNHILKDIFMCFSVPILWKYC